MKPPDLESFIHKRLSELPAPNAPGTLLPRIMAEAIGTGGSPRRQWSWPGSLWGPPAVRLAAWTVLILVGGLLLDWTSGGRIGYAWGVFLAAAEEAAIGAATMVHEAQVLWRVLLEPIAVYLILWVGCMLVFLALLWEALRSMLWEGSVR